MSAPTNHWKLGAFVVGSVVAGLAVTAVLAAQALQIVTVPYTSYVDEAVTGLEVGSPVTYRGVKIGSVSGIDVAPDRRHVELNYSLGVAVLKRLRLSGTSLGKETKITIPPELRLQLASNGLTGTKSLQIDFFDTAGAPAEVLPFPVPENTIPATPSTMKNLEDTIVRAVVQLPDILRDVGAAASHANLLLGDVHQRGLPARLVTTLETTNRTLGSLQAKLDQLPVQELSRDAAATLARMNHLIARLDGEDGLFASVQQTTDAMGALAGPRLEQNIADTGRDLREAAVAVRELAQALQRDPDMLLKGKSKVQK